MWLDKKKAGLGYNLFIMRRMALDVAPIRIGYSMELKGLDRSSKNNVLRECLLRM